MLRACSWVNKCQADRKKPIVRWTTIVPRPSFANRKIPQRDLVWSRWSCMPALTSRIWWFNLVSWRSWIERISSTYQLPRLRVLPCIQRWCGVLKVISQQKKSRYTGYSTRQDAPTDVSRIQSTVVLHISWADVWLHPFVYHSRRTTKRLPATPPPKSERLG